MVPDVSTGGRTRGLLSYLFGPGRRDEHQDPHIVAAWDMAGAPDPGRDPDAIEITTGGAAAFAPDPVEALGELAELGVSRVVIPPLSFDPTAISDVLAEFGETVIAKTNA